MKYRWWLFLLVTISAVAIVTVGYYILVTGVIMEETPRTPGTFGDMFGLLATIFSGFALSGVAVTSYLQYRTFERDRAERLREHFMALLDRNESLTSRIAVTANGDLLQGRQALKQLAENLIAKTTGLTDRSELIAEFDKFYEENEFHLSSYFKNQNYLLRFIKNSNLLEKVKSLDETEKSLTLNLYKSQLTEWELQLTFYNVLSRGEHREDKSDAINESNMSYAKNALDFEVLSGLKRKKNRAHLPLNHHSIFNAVIDRSGQSKDH